MSSRESTRRVAQVVIPVGLLVGGFIAGYASRPGWTSLIHGSPQVMVTTADIVVGEVAECWGDVTLSQSKYRGRVAAGTPVEVRRHGPRHWVTAQFWLSDLHPPLRPLTKGEATRMERQYVCGRRARATDATSTTLEGTPSVGAAASQPSQP